MDSKNEEKNYILYITLTSTAKTVYNNAIPQHLLKAIFNMDRFNDLASTMTPQSSYTTQQKELWRALWENIIHT